MYSRPIFKTVFSRISEPRRFIQVLAGPRQTGKTTLAQQVMDAVDIPCHYASADEPALKDISWIEQNWETARARLMGSKRKQALLILDEIQKIPGWSDVVKRLWDEDTRGGISLILLVLGSSPLLVQKGLTESLAGRFEIIPVTHWSYQEMRDAFGWGLNRYIFYGGYPGAASLVTDPERWRRYIRDSLIEPTISRDILLMQRVDKPALLRRLFELGCLYSGRILSYQKMLGQLQEAGNTTTLAHYLDLLGGAGLVMGLQKYAGQHVRQRASSPKLLVLNAALMTALSDLTLDEAEKSPEYWGRMVESAIGASLANAVLGKGIGLYYWVGRNREVDFVLKKGNVLTAIEVKSGRKRDALPGMDAFSKEFAPKRKLLVGTGGIGIEEFLLTPVENWVT